MAFLAHVGHASRARGEARWHARGKLSRQREVARANGPSFALDRSVHSRRGDTHMLCSEIMKSAIECVSPNDTAEVAAQRMRDHNIGLLPVCTRELKVVGTVT